MTPYIPIVLGSAAIGALTSSIITLIGQSIERRSRRAELVLSESVKMAQTQMETMLTLAAASPDRATNIIPLIHMTGDYHKWLTHLLEKGVMHPEYEMKR